MSLLFEEVLLFEMNFIGKLIEELRSEIKEELKRERTLKELQDKLNHLTPAEGVKFLMLQMTPCMSHMETRVGLKIMSLILQDGLSNAKGSLLPSTQNIRSEYQREQIYNKHIEGLFNTTILGNMINKYQHDLPLEDDPKGSSRIIGVINFENNKVRNIIQILEKIIDLSHVDVSVRNKLKNGMSDYRKAWCILRKKEENYAETELIDYKCYMNNFCASFVEVFGRKLFTNYFHMIIADHVCDYMVEWRNLSV